MTQVANDRVFAMGQASGAEPKKAHISENAQNVLRSRYLIKDESGRCTEAPEDLYRRVARTVAQPETLYDPSETHRGEWEERFFDLMAECKFMPNSPTLMNAGREMGMLSACFVLPVRDSINDIFDSIKHTALIQKAGGGTGFAFDELRPTGDYIKSSGGTTSGPISFWRAFSEATNAIQQGAFRRGANMGMMYIDHPDILKFLHAKEDLNQFTNYNISVKMTDAWMEAFRADPDSPHVVRNPRTNVEYFLPRSLDIWKYDIRSLIPADEQPAPGSVYTRREIWDIIVNNAWKTGEPGVVFMDRINEDNPTPHIGRMEATNPCGEQPLLPYEACNLGSVNLARFIVNENTPQADVGWDALRTTIHESTRFLDNVIDANNYPLPEIDAVCKANRKIGLGVMGFADALFKLGVGYNTEEGVAWGERFMKFLNDESHAYSERLARERGSFPNWKGSLWETRYKRPMRNACCTTVAPTGTISIIADCSCGIEPLFSLVFYRNVLKGQRKTDTPMIEINSIFKQVMAERGVADTELYDKIATDGTLAHIENMPDDIRRTFVCAHDVSPEWHVKMQAAFQQHCDASISKTINFPEHATRDDVETIYRMSYDLKCKGVTVYRNGCRMAQPMALKSDDQSDKNGKPAQEAAVVKKPASRIDAETAVKPVGNSAAKESQPQQVRPLEPADLPELLSSVRVKQMTPFGNMHVQITVDPKNERELEVFAQLGKGGDLANSDLEAMCRLTSLWLRSGGQIKHVVRQLKGIGSSLQVSTKEGKIMSLGDGLARALNKYARARTHFGLRSLLLGEFDIEEMDCILAGKHPLSKQTNGMGKKNGDVNGKGNSASNGNGNGNGGHRVEAERIGTGPRSRVGQSQQEAFKVKCPECHALLTYGEGCVMCHSCGYSHC